MKETAAVMGRSVDAVKGCQHRALARMARVVMVRPRGAVDHRLLDGRAVTARVLAAMLTEHDCSNGRACMACGYWPSRRQPVCRSVALVQGRRVGYAPQVSATQWVAS